MKTMALKDLAKKFFEEELSGEPLTQDSVIEGLANFAKEILSLHIEHPRKPGYKRSDIIARIKD